MSLETSLANIIIKDNILDQGRSSDGTTPVTYNYSYHAWVQGSAIIDSNVFSAPAASSDMLYLDECSCIITKNKFIRNGTSISSYIRNTGAYDHVITHNIFDESTIDGSDDVIIKSLSNKSVCHSNKNQTIYVPVVWFDSIVDIPSSATDTILGLGGIANPNVQRQNNYINITRTSTANSSLVADIPLGQSIPEGATLLECKIGLASAINGVTFTGDNTFSLILIGQETLSANYSAGLGSLLDVFVRRTTVAQSVTSTYDMATNTASLQGATQYVTVAPTLDYFTNNGNSVFTLFLSCKIQTSVITSLVHRFSPIILKCRW